MRGDLGGQGEREWKGAGPNGRLHVLGGTRVQVLLIHGLCCFLPGLGVVICETGPQRHGFPGAAPEAGNRASAPCKPQ